MRKLNRIYAITFVFLIISFPVVFAYFGIGNFEVAPPEGAQIDTDGDGIPDWWEDLDWFAGACRLDKSNSSDASLDFDNDGFSNWLEYDLRLNPCLSNVDGDLDGIPDVWEDDNGLDKFNNDTALDPDSDGLINIDEFLEGTNPQDSDSDSDNIPDGWEVEYTLDPLDASDALIDIDGDNLTNLAEYIRGTNPLAYDTDGDGTNDFDDPCPTDASNICVDQDGDGILDSEDPCPTDFSNGCVDSDGDGISDVFDPCPDDPTDSCVDSDGDGISDGAPDLCPNTPAGEPVDITGCSASQIDSDVDGVSDLGDICPGTPIGYSVDANGCIIDSDSDGVNDLYDLCPGTLSGSSVDNVGCIVTDSDGDGIPDSDDPCPADTNLMCGTGEVLGTVDNINNIMDFADVSVDAKVLDTAIVSGFADISGSAIVSGSAQVIGFADVSGNAIVTDNAKVEDSSVVMGNATVSGAAMVVDSALITDAAIITESATISGNATISGDAKVQGTSEVKDTAKVTGNSTISGASIVSGSTEVSGLSTVQDSIVSDTVVFNSFIDPSEVSNSKVLWSRVWDSIVIDTNLQYTQIRDLTVRSEKVIPMSSGVGTISIEDVNFTITPSNLKTERTYTKLVDGHKRSTNLQIDGSGKTLKIFDEDNPTAQAGKFAEVKILTPGNIIVNVTVAKVAINPTGGVHLSNRYGDYLSVEEDNDLLTNINPNSTIKIYYNLDDMNDEGEHNESTLVAAYYDESTGTWKNTSFSKRGEDATGRYVIARVDHFSILGIYGSILPCPITQKWCSVLNSCIFILDKCEAELGGGGGGGGGGALLPRMTLPPIFTGGVIFLTPQLLIEVILRRNLVEKMFWSVPNSVGASLILTGEYPSPFSPIVRGALSRPIRLLLEPLKVFRGEKVESPETVKDVYRFSTKRVLSRYPSSEVVVIAVREPPADSMAAVAYAKSINAPILLTEKDEAPLETINATLKLNPKKIVIVGGTSAVSSNVESEFKKIAATERIWGPTRYETAVELAKKLNPEMVVITDGEAPSPDALILASEYKAPIIYVSGSELPEPTRDFLIKHTNTNEGNPMSWITVGVEKDIHTEIQIIYALPDFLKKNRLTIKLYQVGNRFL